MTTLSIWLLSIFIPLTTLLVSFVLYVVIKSYFLKKYSNKLEELENFLSHEPYIDTLTALRTVDITLKEQEKTIMQKITSASNDEIQINDVKIDEINNAKEGFAHQHIQIEEKIKHLTKLKNQLLDNLNYSRVFSSRKIIKSIENTKRDLVIIKKDVNDKTRDLINPITDFANKKREYEKIVRVIQKQILIWKEEVQNDTFISTIDKKFEKMEEYLGLASDFVASQNQDDAFSYFALFKKKLFDFINFANYFDKFYEVLFIKANESYEKVIDYLQKVRSNLSSNLENLNVNVFLENVEDELQKAKLSFYELDVKGTEEKIEKYFNSLLGLTFAITSELNAYNFFSRYSELEIKRFIQAAKEKLKDIKDMGDKLIHIDKSFYWIIQKNINDLENIFEQNLELVNNFINDSIDSYSLKQSKYKKICQQFYEFFIQINEIEKTIDMFYTEGISQGLKYNHLKKIFINGLADIKKFQIKLSIEDNELIKSIENKKNEIENWVAGKNSYNDKDLKLKVDTFFSMMIDFVMKIIKKVLLVRIFTLINLQYSYKRLESKIYNIKIKSLEEEVQEGKYYESVKNLIEVIRGDSN